MAKNLQKLLKSILKKNQIPTFVLQATSYPHWRQPLLQNSHVSFQIYVYIYIQYIFINIYLYLHINIQFILYIYVCVYIYFLSHTNGSIPHMEPCILPFFLLIYLRHGTRAVHIVLPHHFKDLPSIPLERYTIIYLTTDSHLGYFQPFAMTNNAATNILTCSFDTYIKSFRG